MNNNYTPCIILPGFGQSKAVLVDENGNTVRKVWPLSVDSASAKSMLKQIIGPYCKTVLRRKDSGFSDTAYDLYRQVMSPFETLPDGTMKYRLRAIEQNQSLAQCNERVKRFIYRLVPVKKLADRIGENNLYYFAYNAFSSPFDIADDLQKFVTMVKEQTGSEKVNLLTFSLGGAVSTAFFTKYGDRNEIERVLYLGAALRGTVLIADVLDRKIDKNEGYSLLEFFTSTDMVKKFKAVLSLTTWEVRYNLLYRSLDACVDTLIVNSPGMWALVPPSLYPVLRDKLIAGEPNKKLREQTDDFHEAQKKLEETIYAMRNNGTRFFTCAGYDLQIMPLSLSRDVSTDGIVPVSSAGLVPETALGETPDTTKGILPESTWLIPGLKHTEFASSEKAAHLVASVFTDENPAMLLGHL